jgi:hypothetical protein
VRRLERGARSAGDHVRTWDRRDDAGARVARGVYIVQLTAGPDRLVRKLVLVRE